jgi:outer membrane protein assembly factor BamA
MRKRWKYGLMVACVCFSSARLCAQDSAPPSTGIASPGNEIATVTDSTHPFVIRNIVITGNRKTKPYIIERELPFKRGDSVNLSELVSRFQRSRELLLNTALFHEAIVYLKTFHGYEVDVGITVKERWYLFPIPYVKPVDRNLAEWAKQGYGFDRLNYGLKLNYNNFTGRSDKLKFWLITGYSKQIQFQYELPYVDKSLKNGVRFGFNYRTNKEVNYATIDNEQTFHSDKVNDIVMSKQWSVFFDFTNRPAIRTKNSFHFAYVSQVVDTSITTLNPKYFDNGTTKLAFPELGYKLEFTNVDYIPYPQKGVAAEAGILKRGFSKEFNMWQFSAKGAKHNFLAPKLSYTLQASGTLRVPFDQPFINQQLFGYGDFYLRGLENYVTDGVAAILSKNTLRYQLLQFNIPTPFNSHDQIPFRVFVKTYADAGYAYNKYNVQNSLGNRMLYTGGFGVDILTFYDLSFKIEYSFNQLGQSGFFFHFKNDF